VLLDGIDLSSLYLREVRARKPHGMVVIPQDPVLFSGTLRDCLDPFQSFQDHELLEVLRAVGINTDRNEKKRKKKSTISSKASSNPLVAVDNVLEAAVHEGGSNWSVGERQLLALARALLEKPKVNSMPHLFVDPPPISPHLPAASQKYFFLNDCFVTHLM
jgi:ATP-binding cassette, subfamily C (CFTR/MRP), member 1